jgi:hypothetical protein
MTALGAALRKKFKTPQDALSALGLDAALLGDNKEDEMTTSNRLSPRGMLAKGALLTFLRPRLAQDAKIELNPLLAGVTAKNFSRHKSRIEAAIHSAYAQHLAQDADLQDVAELLEAIERIKDEDEGEDVTEANSGFPMGGRREDEEDPDAMDGTEHAVEFLRDKLSPEDHEKVCGLLGHHEDDDAEDWMSEDACAMRAADARKKLGRDETSEEREKREAEDRRRAEDMRKRADDRKRAMDARRAEDARKKLGRDETPEEMAKRMRGEEAEDRRRAEDRKRARDARRADDRKRADDARRARDAEPKPITREAMDAAIREAVAGAQRSAAQTQREIRDAERAARPYVGEMTVACDSAEDVYRNALKVLRINVDGVHPSAYRTILEMQPKPGANRPRLATDALPAGIKSTSERFPGAARVQVMG